MDSIQDTGTEPMTNETGPIYCIPLIERMPLGDSGMTQAMPSRADLRMCRGRNERVAAGYEVLLAHYHRVCEERDALKRILSKVQLTQALEHIELDAKP